MGHAEVEDLVRVMARVMGVLAWVDQDHREALRRLLAMEDLQMEAYHPLVADPVLAEYVP